MNLDVGVFSCSSKYTRIIFYKDARIFNALGDRPCEFFKTSNFFSVSFSMRTFFFRLHLPADHFFVCKQFFRDFSFPPPSKKMMVPSVRLKA